MLANSKKHWVRNSVGAIQGIIRRRILLNYAVDPDIMQRHLPTPFRPKLHNGVAVAGICMIRLEQIRPLWLPVKTGITSENAAHRIAVEWTDEQGETKEGVYIPRRDTSSRINHWAGGRLFPSEHHLASFNVTDSGDKISFQMQSRDSAACINLSATVASEIADSSIFSSVAEASKFFEQGCDGFSPSLHGARLDAIRLCIANWQVTPLKIEEANAAWFDDESNFPSGTARLDHALLMRDIPHQWQPMRPISRDPGNGAAPCSN